MYSTTKTLFVLGGSGFIGRAVIEAAVAAGWTVSALARSNDAASAVRAAGATPISGSAEAPREWIDSARSCDVLIDLLQPARSKRLTREQMRAMSGERQMFTRALLDALRSSEGGRLPRLISVSGIDDLGTDASGAITAHSPLRRDEYGFNTIGIPVRRIIENANVDASFAYLGVVYGRGGAFGKEIFPALAAGKWTNFGSREQRMILVHVRDAARGLVAIADLPSGEAVGGSYVLTDDEPVSMSDFFGLAAHLLDVKAPRHVPGWLAGLVAGKPIVETTLHCERAISSFPLLHLELLYPTYREGLYEALGVTAREATPT